MQINTDSKPRHDLYIKYGDYTRKIPIYQAYAVPYALNPIAYILVL